ncbi:MAG: sulfotransferase [Hydrococcus sp. C42_A2020_068]|uniref:sulfotransferase family protein n=1 Tax=Pleurocapsa sp. PCC 7327 TaxID=118163 RepID=UPI0002A00110|nr:sulfotransferase [Pleurocapsa sp. PCC 7327]AFY79482.1 sulfotransferase family protein [Pleurocapsa sp. PCC 7327]MBF2021055.1 sulfotransferase [Hydrococcus sp. C42_A2020_068]
METNTKSPIFIVGCPRSGTTLLQQMLDAHPDIAIAPETHFIRNFYLKRETYGDLTQDVNYCRLIEDIVALPVFLEMGLNAEYFREAAWKIERSYAAIFNLILQQFAYTKNARIVGEKTPNHLLYMSILEQFFPTARFIHIIRDPRAVINSWRKVPWSNGSLHEDAEVWRRYMATARLSPPSQAPILTLHYEQLVLNPEMSLRSVCDFLGLPFERVMLSYHLLLSQTINTVREPWKNQATQSISQKSLDLWKKELSPSMVAEIEAVVWSEMKLFGYQTQTPLLQILIKSIPNQTKRNFRQIKNRLFQSIQTRLKTIATD